MHRRFAHSIYPVPIATTQARYTRSNSGFYDGPRQQNSSTPTPVPRSTTYLPPEQQAPDEAKEIPQHYDGDDDNGTQLQHGDLVALLGHAGHPARTAADTGAHAAEDLVRVVDGRLVARVVVDVQRHVFQRRRLLLERGEEGVVLSTRLRVSV